MFIKSMVLDGFKSYGVRVEINDFDREFNAITGLNGTGKSNILDGICFVLGIQGKQVRANTLQELIYKNGQAGITKASVTLTFDNTDKKNCPIGYENDNVIVICRQISIPNNTRYMINGSSVNPKRVSDLFSSVSLNVNNPHFLIMQGRVTKVLNMKPHEILSMLEEAAGTGMYESKKIAAQKLISKKEAKLGNLKDLITEEICPKIEKLKGEKEKYLELQKVTREAEHWGKIYTAFSYWSLLQKISKGEEDRNKKITELEKGQNAMKEKQKEIESVEQLIGEIQVAMNEESSGKLVETESKLAEERKNEALISAKYQSEKDSISAEEKKLNQLIKSVQDDKNALKKKEKEMSDMDKKYEKLKIEDENDKEAYSAAQHKFQAISAGLFAAEDGSVGTLQDQIIAMKSQISTAETECKQCEMKLSHIKSKIPEKKKLMQQTESDSGKDKQLLESKQKELKRLNEDLKRLNYEEGAYESLDAERQEFTRNKQNAQSDVYNLLNRDRGVEFQYTDPAPNFDRSRVKGRVARLVTVKDPKYALAIETALGGLVFNVVVDDENTSQLLIQNGNLVRRTTFIPLSKIRSNVMDARVIKTAQNLVGKENVFPALSLISYKPEYQRAMEFLLGNIFVCASGDVAKRVTFCPEIRKKSITLDGEVYDHSGVLSGGSKINTAGILGRVQQMLQAERTFEITAATLQALEKKMSILERNYNQYSELKHARDLASHELSRLEERLQKTTFFSHKQEYEDLVNKQAELEQKIKDCKKIVKENAEKVKEKESNMNNIEGLRERELENAKKEMKRLKDKADKSGDLWKQKEQEYETHKLEINDLKKAIEKGEENVEQFKEELNQVKSEVGKLEEEAKNVKERVRILEADIKVQKDVLNEKNGEIQRHKKTKDKCLIDIKKLTNLVTDIEAELKNVEKESENIQEKITQLEEDHTWISSEKSHFGNPDGVYDFSKMSAHEVTRKYQKLKEHRDKLERTVDKKAQLSLRNEENQFKEAMTKKSVVESDRNKLLKVIEELDEKKKKALREAWVKVNTDFGSIFSLLLPGSQAKLSPPAGKDILDGLEVNVAFGGLWKESLGELSGGQRSLVALSLVLAMLLFKPAPLYILDEVDAALDLSHTQNIGHMLKRHFKTSQFIIVSLKEGMFSNANVIFRTKFVDGNSNVTRTVNRKK